MSSGLVFSLDNVSYYSFPTARELLSLSSNLTLSFIDFIRTLGIHGRDQTAHFLKSAPEEIDQLCRKCRLNLDVNQSSLENAVELRRHWQREILGGLTRKFKVNLREILARAKERSTFYRLDAVAKEVRYVLGNLMRRLTNDSNNKSPKGVIDYQKVDAILENCQLTPIRTWEEAQKSSNYVRALLVEAFPHTPVSLIANYLFKDHPVPQNITYYCLRHRINRPQISHNTPIHREEQIAFAKWTGYDAKTFIAEQAEKVKSWRHYL